MGFAGVAAGSQHVEKAIFAVSHSLLSSFAPFEVAVQSFLYAYFLAMTSSEASLLVMTVSIYFDFAQ